MIEGAAEREGGGAVACMHCGYALRGLGREGTCPECGAYVDESISAAELAGSVRSDAAFSASTSYVASTIVLLAPLSIAAVTLSFRIEVGPVLGCLVPLCAFLHICLVLASSLAMSNDSLGERQSTAERLIGGLGTALIVGSMALPVLVTAMADKPGRRNLELIALGVCVGWFLLYATVHALSAILFARTAERVAARSLPRPLRLSARGFAVGAAGVLVAALLLALTTMLWDPDPPPKVVVGSVLVVNGASLLLHAASQVLSTVYVARLRRFLRRAKRSARVPAGSGGGADAG